jgi:hypothetical protein
MKSIIGTYAAIILALLLSTALFTLLHEYKAPQPEPLTSIVFGDNGFIGVVLPAGEAESGEPLVVYVYLRNTSVLRDEKYRSIGVRVIVYNANKGEKVLDKGFWLHELPGVVQFRPQVLVNTTFHIVVSAFNRTREIDRVYSTVKVYAPVNPDVRIVIDYALVNNSEIIEEMEKIASMHASMLGANETRARKARALLVVRAKVINRGPIPVTLLVTGCEGEVAVDLVDYKVLRGDSVLAPLFVCLPLICWPLGPGEAFVDNHLKFLVYEYPLEIEVTLRAKVCSWCPGLGDTDCIEVTNTTVISVE